MPKIIQIQDGYLLDDEGNLWRLYDYLITKTGELVKIENRKSEDYPYNIDETIKYAKKVRIDF